ncbi:MAG: hypothetical protein FWC13_11710 [Oscillospiraceae bacterium]|nr:hypothetical protein [Oscillospiraceae bacterium]
MNYYTDTTDEMLNIADYGISIAGIAGADTTPTDIALCLGQAGRLMLAPHSVKAPMNTTVKMFVTVAAVVYGESTGKKRAASVFSLFGKGLTDLLIRE